MSEPRFLHFTTSEGGERLLHIDTIVSIAPYANHSIVTFTDEHMERSSIKVTMPFHRLREAFAAKSLIVSVAREN